MTEFSLNDKKHSLQKPKKIYFYKTIVCPHMIGLAESLANLGHEVFYVFQKSVSERRLALGWSELSVENVKLIKLESLHEVKSFIEEIPPDSVHVCQGLKSSPIIKNIKVRLSERGIKHYVIMETVKDSGFKGVLKKFYYSYSFKRYNSSIEGVLAIGKKTPSWVVDRGVEKSKVFPFAYFVSNSEADVADGENMKPPTDFLKVIFVGQAIKRKRLDLLVDGVRLVPNSYLTVIGSGPLQLEIKKKCEEQIFGRYDWLGVIPREYIPEKISEADVLVLPSDFDGWGAVITESLMVGTPVICSNACGAAEVVAASKVGGVFEVGSLEDLAFLLEKESLVKSAREKRKSIRRWAKKIASDAGAEYFHRIICFSNGGVDKPAPPWVSKF